MSETKLNWESAAVKDGGLSVELDGKVSKDWKHSFEDTVKLLGSGQWGEVKLKKQTVRVDDVTPGEEDNLRFFLESVVEQANASATAREAEAAADKNAEGDDDRDRQREASGPDADMTERFRSFSAQGQGDGDAASEPD
jgi:hypothetical protein